MAFCIESHPGKSGELLLSMFLVLMPLYHNAVSWEDQKAVSIPLRLLLLLLRYRYRHH